MTETEIYQTVAKLIQEQKGRDLKKGEELTIQNDLFTDSVEFMEFIITLEDAFNIEISDEVADRFTTVSDLVNYIHEEIRNKA